MKVESIFVYPIKSCKGVQVQRAQIDEYGFKYDRRFMIINADRKRFVTQRQVPAMALITPNIHHDEKDTTYLEISVPHKQSLMIPLSCNSKDQRPCYSVGIWDDTVEVEDCGDVAAVWLTEYLSPENKVQYRLVKMAEGYLRTVSDKEFVISNKSNYNPKVSLADATPFLLASVSSLEHVNSHLPEGTNPIAMNRFRPNLIINGPNSSPFVEDNWKVIQIGKAIFSGINKCSRCKLTTVDPEKGIFGGEEPLGTLKRIRKSKQDKGSVFFGQALVHQPSAFGDTISVGDFVKVLEEVSDMPDILVIADEVRV